MHFPSWLFRCLYFLLTLYLYGCGEGGEPHPVRQEIQEGSSLVSEVYPPPPPLKGEIGWKWIPQVQGSFEITKIVARKDLYFIGVLEGSLRIDSTGIAGAKLPVLGSLDTCGAVRWIKPLKGIQEIEPLGLFVDGDTLKLLGLNNEDLSLYKYDFKGNEIGRKILDKLISRRQDPIEGRAVFFWLDRKKVIIREDSLFIAYESVKAIGSTGSDFLSEMVTEADIVVDCYTLSGNHLWNSRVQKEKAAPMWELWIEDSLISIFNNGTIRQIKRSGGKLETKIVTRIHRLNVIYTTHGVFITNV